MLVLIRTPRVTGASPLADLMFDQTNLVVLPAALRGRGNADTVPTLTPRSVSGG
jgi:hypothetical protein